MSHPSLEPAPFLVAQTATFQFDAEMACPTPSTDLTGQRIHPADASLTVPFPRFASDYKALIKRIRPVASCQVEIISLKIGVAAHSQRRRNPTKCQTGTTFWNTASNCTLKNKVLHYVTRIKFTSQILNEFNSKNFHFKHLRVPHIGQARPCHRIKRRSPSKI